jgi:hypothetical protein
VNGGEIISGGGADVSAIYMGNPAGWVSIQGGEVRRTADGGYAIYSLGFVYVSNGKVRATSGFAIYSSGSNMIVNGNGAVFAHGSGITGAGNVISTDTPFDGATGNGVVIAWNQVAGQKTYAIGTDEDISKSPAEATAVWAKRGGKTGIAYTNGGNTGFIEIDGITLTGDSPVLTSLSITDFQFGAITDGYRAFILTISYEGTLPDDGSLKVRHWETLGDGSNNHLAPHVDDLGDGVAILTVSIPDDIPSAFFKIETVEE